MEKKQPYSLFWAYQEILNRLPKRRRNQTRLLIIAMIVSAVETFALSCVAFFASAITDPETAIESNYIAVLSEFTGFTFFRDSKGLIITLGVLVALMIPIKNIGRGLISYLITKFSTLIEVSFGEKLLGGFLYSDYQWALNRNTADLILAVTWRSYIGRNFFNPCLVIASDLSITLLLFAALMIVDPFTTISAILIIGITSFMIYYVLKKWLDKIAAVCKKYQQTINKEITRSIHGMKDVKVTATQKHFLKVFRNNATPFSRYLAIQKFLSQAPVLILECIVFISMSGLSIFMILAMEVSVSKLVGIMSLMGVAAWRILPAISRAVASFAKIRNALPFIKSVLEYLDETRDLHENSTSQVKNENKINFLKKIELDNIDFSYSQSDVKILNNISIKINKGETIGIVGTSGSGKSTLVDLIIGLLNPTKNTISIDGTALNKENLSGWLKHIGYVPQSPYIFDGTLAENIAFGTSSKGIDRSKVMDCCAMAAIDFIERLPKGIDTNIGERGARLSGGQQQRVAIARALYHDPDLLIFDEATSALDSKSEEAIQKTIYSFKGHQTLLIIAHRLSTVKECDKVLWLKDSGIKMFDTPNIVLPLYKETL